MCVIVLRGIAGVGSAGKDVISKEGVVGLTSFFDTFTKNIYNK